ncbi:hypothetical protein HF295_04300 [Hujiaoplasma nucleasis]|uniref:Aminopeptidase n=1 Tax=Hujiaoplasma nucleasis TaxID=2725268 RepID=A0A7L6N546_9MOLU|nr:C1 family peptidase [Hujiaoplasma nucleasis]QLY40125.1 hypothetical protein HF295_04300 [Hujiaoplasma nucleasis]
MDDEVVWFGCDVGFFGDRDLGIWDDGRFDYDEILNIDLSISKANMLDYNHSRMNHAMVLTGVSIHNGQARKWKIENSWGDKSEKKDIIWLVIHGLINLFIRQSSIKNISQKNN